jgi:hypothetical protein
MSRTLDAESDIVASHGEVWTDARGYAHVELPIGTVLAPPIEYELRDLDPPTSARVTAELADGRFTIATDEPHVKVGWRITGRRARAGESTYRQGAKGEDR